MTELKQRPGDQPLPTPNGRRDVQSLVMDDIAARRAVGISRYGTALQSFNGRDALRDLYEELLDACTYIRQVIEERDTPPAEPTVKGADLERLIRQAVSDPGSFLKRGDDYSESIPHWGTRAVLTVLADAGLIAAEADL